MYAHKSFFLTKALDYDMGDDEYLFVHEQMNFFGGGASSILYMNEVNSLVRHPKTPRSNLYATN